MPIKVCQMSVMALVFLGVVVSLRAETADIRDAPGGKRLLFVDGIGIRDQPGGKRRLFIDGKELRTEPGGKVLLFVDGDDIRTIQWGQDALFRRLFHSTRRVLGPVH